jgi:hypothetical protein
MINLPAFQVAYPEMMLWVIMVGGLASITTVHQEFFTKILADACLAVGINNPTEELPVFLAEFWADVVTVQAQVTGGERSSSE